MRPITSEFNQSTYGSLSIGTDSQTITNKYKKTFVDFFLLTFKIKLIDQLIGNCSYANRLKTYNPTNFNIFKNGIVELTDNVSDEDLIKIYNDYSNNHLIANNVIDVFRNIFKTNKDDIISKYKEYFDDVKRNVYAIINSMAIPSTPHNNSSFQSKNDPRLKAAIALFGGNRTQQPVYIRTQQKLKTSKGMRCIYLGKRGGQYVKIDGQFRSVKSLTK